MRIFLITGLLVFIATLISINSYCQSTISVDSIKSNLIKDWERGKAYTQDYMNTMPGDKYSFRAMDSVRTFAEQMLHIADANVFFVTTATGYKAPFGDIEKRSSAQSADSVKYYVNSSYDFVINSIKKLPATALMQKASFTMGETITLTRLSWLLKSFEHQTHHRGQTTIYLRLAGIRPPGERLF